MDSVPVMSWPPCAKDGRIFEAGRMRVLEALYTVGRGHGAAAPLQRGDGDALHRPPWRGGGLPRHDPPRRGRRRALHGALVRRAAVFVNYHGFDCRAELEEELAAAARRTEARFYGSVRRVSSAALARPRGLEADGVDAVPPLRLG